MIACLFTVFHTFSFFVGVQPVADGDPDFGWTGWILQPAVRENGWLITFQLRFFFFLFFLETATRRPFISADITGQRIGSVGNPAKPISNDR